MKKKSNVIGLRPVPPDAVLEEFISQTIQKDTEVLEGQLELLWDAVEDCLSKSQPENFAYARLLNFLASHTLSKPELIHLCSAAMWKLYQNEEQNGEETEIHPS